MAYDERLAARVDVMLEIVEAPDVLGMKMFGGIGYTVLGNMACGVHKENLIARVGPDKYEAALARSGVGVFDITGRPMKGWVFVEPAAVEADADLKTWVMESVTFALTLPPK